MSNFELSHDARQSPVPAGTFLLAPGLSSGADLWGLTAPIPNANDKSKEHSLLPFCRKYGGCNANMAWCKAILGYFPMDIFFQVQVLYCA
jgi:hypothetical protein